MEVVSGNHYAGFTKRLLAFIIDRVLIWMILYIVLGYARGFKLYSVSSLFSIQTIFIDLLIMVYFVVFETSSWQATPGKHFLNMRVVTEGYHTLSAENAAWRYIWKYLSALVLMLGFIWVIFDPRKQGWHDKLAHTYVIEI
jgi:uncharacterized RDD family membrane protein YckC